MSLIALTPEQTGKGSLWWDTELSRVVLSTDNNPFTVTEVVMGASVKITADQTNSTLVVSDITGLSFSVVSGTYYHFRFIIPFATASTTTGIALTMTFPAATVFAAAVRIPVIPDSVSGEFQGWIKTTGDVVIGTGVPTTTENFLATIEGMILPSVDGTIQVRFRSEIDTSLVTVRQGASGFIVAY